LWDAVDEIADLNDRIIGLQQVKDSEKTMFERQLQQLRNEYKETKDQLIASNIVLGNCLFITLAFALFYLIRSNYICYFA